MKSTMKYINLQEICKELNIYEFGVAFWPLPENAKSILYESNPCPFTAANVEERLLGTSLFTPKSAIVCLFPYYVEHKDPSNLSRYTWATDYHLVINEYLKKLIEKLQIMNTDAQFSIHCDTSPLADRYMAYLAGLGFYGKNNCFISPKWGSYVMIGTILTTLELEPNTPLNQSCMECNRCITACLGQCLGLDEFKFDTCKSYLTQKKGELTSEEEHIIAKTPLVFGCDVCQEVCPHNKDISTTPIPEFQSVEPYIDIDELDSLTNKEFKAKYGQRAFSWRGKKILRRNQEIIESKKLL